MTYKWTPEQEKILHWFKEPTGENLVVEARAGGSKTTIIQNGFSFAPEKKMLYCVFGKKNQVEAAGKIIDSRVEIKTLHALGFHFIKKVWPRTMAKNWVENDRIDAVAPTIKLGTKMALRRLIAFAKNLYIEPTEKNLLDICLDRDIDSNDTGVDLDKLVSYAMKALDLARTPDKQNRISFDDMVWLPMANNLVTPTYDLVVVDECQDMNIPQLFMAKKASKGRVCVVGDSCQAIYYFRGAASDGMELMRKELNAKDLTLSVSFRCPKAVVKEAQAYVPDIKAPDWAKEGTVDTLSRAELLSNAKVGEVVLSRLNAPLMTLCLAFIRNKVAARIEGKDIGDALILILDSLNASSVDDFLTKIDVWRSQTMAKVAKTRNGAQKADIIDDQAETLIAVAEGVNTIPEMKARLESLFIDSEGKKVNAVILSTVHKAKGLEWDKVFILKDTFGRRSAVTEEEAREERNINYVAITRSKDHLTYITN